MGASACTVLPVVVRRWAVFLLCLARMTCADGANDRHIFGTPGLRFRNTGLSRRRDDGPNHQLGVSRRLMLQVERLPGSTQLLESFS
jgi:hypothetical protein